MNGLIPPPITMSTEFDTGDHHSDSDLSDGKDVVVAHPDTRAPSSDPEELPAQNDIAHDAPASDGEANSASTHDDASDDGDFDMDEGAPSPQSAHGRDHRSASLSSRPSSKQKSPAENSYIQQNPELYGLRRSVRWQLYSHRHRTSGRANTASSL